MPQTVTMKPEVLLLPLECMDHKHCTKLYEQRFSSTSPDSPEFSVTIKFEKVSEEANEAEPNRNIIGKVPCTNTSADEMMSVSSVSPSVTMGVIHFKVELEDGSENKQN